MTLIACWRQAPRGQQSRLRAAGNRHLTPVQLQALAARCRPPTTRSGPVPGASCASRAQRATDASPALLYTRCKSPTTRFSHAAGHRRQPLLTGRALQSSDDALHPRCRPPMTLRLRRPRAAVHPRRAPHLASRPPGAGDTGHAQQATDDALHPRCKPRSRSVPQTTLFTPRGRPRSVHPVEILSGREGGREGLRHFYLDLTTSCN
jgi:hypothetical protein